MTISCDSLLERMGYECRSVAVGTIEVITPFAFVDGEPVGFYLTEGADGVSLSDNADTLDHFASIGWDIGDRKKWKGIRNIASAFGFELLDSGEIVGKSAQSAQSVFIGKYICALLAVIDLEKDYWGITDEQSQYIEEVEMILKASKPDAELILLPSIEGHSGKMHQFHFQFDGQLIDAARPHGAKTGSILRKTSDLRNAGNQTKILVVMDDRDDAERAAAETDILSGAVSVIQFSRFAKRSPDQSLIH